jgi:hypothetical protein
MRSRLAALVVACTLCLIAIPRGAGASPVYGGDAGSFSGWFGHEIVPLGSQPGATPFALWFTFGGFALGAGAGAPGATPSPEPQPDDAQTSSGVTIYALTSNVQFVNSSVDFDVVAPAVPEASTWAMMLIGLGALGLVARRRRSLAAIG